MVDSRRDLFVSAVRWTAELIDSLPVQVSGICLGDPFCQKRMFANGIFDLPDLARHAKRRGLRVAYQTPVYNTSRTIDDTLALARSLARRDLLDVCLVHDIGVLGTLRNLPVIEVWWDRYSFNRDVDISVSLLEFLREQGVAGVELVRGRDVSTVTKTGMKPLLHIYGPAVTAFGRTCFTEYLLNEPCEQKILCRSSQPYIASADKVPLEYIADGYTLVEKTSPILVTPNVTGDQSANLAGCTATIRSVEEVESIVRRFEALPESNDTRET